jgi:O-acetyl-ADP-ribose deacetylase (regulator of RNase III)
MRSTTLSNGSTIAIKRGDITAERADAIVNAANAHLTPGGGVSGAIHAAAGPGLATETAAVIAKRGPLATGQAVITDGHGLRALHVVHALGPVWHGGDAGEADALARAYRNSVHVADLNNLGSIAFPSISTGIFGYPVALAAPIALHAVAEALSHAATVRAVTFVLYDDATYGAFSAALGEFVEPPA